MAQVAAFPGAVGFGAAATGGRGGTIVHVTNLNDSGPGSFRDAVSAPNRIVVFDVGGYIVLQSPVPVSSNITIAGQTAPGDGIGIMAGEVSLSNQTNIIIRNLRIRQGKLDPLTGKSALNMGNGSNIILDHCSFEYGQWDSVDAVGTKNFTVQNSIIANPIYQQFGAHVEVGPSTFYRDLWVNAHNRQPLSKDSTQYINNVIYDYQSAYTVANTGGYHSHDIVDNYFIAGPATTSPGDAYFQMNSKQSVYAVGNLLDGDKDGTLNGTPANTAGSSLVLAAPWAATTASIPTLDATDAFGEVTASSGAQPRDAVDQFVLSDVNSLGTQGQLYKDQAATGLPNQGYGTLNGGTPFASTANDGIPDYWALANGLSTTDPTVASANWGSTGYTNLEVYFNSLVLPNLWTANDLNAPVLAGASSYNPFTQQWVLTGSGTNPIATFDQGQFASQSWTTNGTLTARLDALTSGEAGLLVRSSSASNAAFVALVRDTSGMLSLLSRSADATSGQAAALNNGVAQGGFGPGVSLRLIRNGSAFAAFVSRDGAPWKLFGVAIAAMSPTSRAGLAVTSNDASGQSTASLSDVSITSDMGSQVQLSAPVAAGGPGQLNVSVSISSSTSTVPTGTVQLFDGSVQLATTGVRDDSTAVFHLPKGLASGVHTLVAVYSGDASHAPGESAPAVITVQP